MSRGWGSGEAFPKEREAETHPLRRVATPQNGPREDHCLQALASSRKAPGDAMRPLLNPKNTHPLKRSRIRGGAAHPAKMSPRCVTNIVTICHRAVTACHYRSRSITGTVDCRVCRCDMSLLGWGVPSGHNISERRQLTHRAPCRRTSSVEQLRGSPSSQPCQRRSQLRKPVEATG